MKNIFLSSTSSRHGFTIVELLVVVVVIGILAAITVTAYGGVQARTHDAVVQEDLQNFSKSLEMYKIEHGSYIAGSEGGGFDAKNVLVSATTGDYAMKFNTGSYGVWVKTTGTYDKDGRIGLGASRGPNGVDNVCLIVGSKSGNKFVYTTAGGITNLGKIETNTAFDAVPGSYKQICLDGGMKSIPTSFPFSGIVNLNDY